MSVRHDLEQQLNQLPPPAAQASQPQAVHLDVAGGRLDCEVSQVDAIGCSVEKLELHTDRLRSASTARLKQASENLAERMRYLLEPVAPVECDAEAGMVRMRSTPPSRDEDGTRYYEVDVTRNEGVIFSRFHAAPGQPRERTPAHLTRETLGRLAEDIVAATEVPEPPPVAHVSSASRSARFQRAP